MGSFKTLGRLIGSNLSADMARFDTTPETGRSPYAPHFPGTKSIALGENWTSAAANRLFVALGINIENLHKLFDAPTLREDVLQYERSSGISTGVYGFPALSVPDPAAIAVANVPEVDLSLDNGTNEPPFVWLHVGLLKRALQSGAHMRFYRESDQSLNGVSGGGNYPAAMFSAELLPSYVKANAGASDYHGAQNYLGDSPHAFPDRIPPIMRVETGLPPYNGALISNTVTAWAPDGLEISARTWKELGARTGCYVEVTGSTNNDGIYHLSEFSDYKAVLTNGNLAKVVVDDATIFTSGQLVAWADPPSHAAAGVSLDALPNKAYVVWKDASTKTLWLAELGSGVDSGSRVTTEISGVLGELEAGRFGKFGQHNPENGADDNSVLPTGTRLYPVDFTTPGATASAEITVYYPPGDPALFVTNDLTGGAVTATLCSPPGFLLNPVVGMPSVASDPNPVVGGDYRLQCRVLSSVREDILNTGSAADMVESRRGAHMPDGEEDRQAEIMRAFLGHLHHGDQVDEDYEKILNHRFSPSRRILGPNLYLVKGTDTATGLVGMGTRVGVDANFTPGAYLEFTHPTATGASSRSYGVVVAGWGEYLLLKDVHREWEVPAESVDYTTMKSIVVGSTCDDAAATEFTVAAAYHPKIRKSVRGAGPVYMESPPDGLNTAYNTLLQSNSGSRGHALGRDVELISGKPIRYALPSVNEEVVNEYWSDQNIAYIHSVKDAAGSTVGRVGFGKVLSAQHEVLLDSKGERTLFRDEAGVVRAFLSYGGVSLVFGDRNIGVTYTDGVSLSGVVHDALPDFVYESDATGIGVGSPPSILGALHAALPGGPEYSSWSNGVLKGCTITASGTAFQVDVTAATFMFKSRHMNRQPGADALGTPVTPSSTEYIYYEFSTDSYDRTATFDVQDDNKIWLAKVTADGVGITSIIDIRQMVHRKDAVIDVTVGDLGGNDYTDNITNFSSLGEALLAIGVWVSAVGQTRAYNIHIIGPVVEVEDAARGLSHPYNVPVDGIHIYGHNDGSSALAKVTWATEKTLLNLNGKDGSIQNVNFLFNPGPAPTRGATPSIGLFTVDTAVPYVWTYDIINCTLENGAYAPEFFFFTNGANQGQKQVLRIRDCLATVSNTGVTVDTTSATNYDLIHLEGCRFYQYDNTDKATNYNDGIYISGGMTADDGTGPPANTTKSTKIILRGNIVDNTRGANDAFTGDGIRVDDCGVGGVTIEDNSIDGCNNGIRVEPVGVDIITNSYAPRIVGNTIRNASLRGLKLSTPFTMAKNNVVYGGCTSAGILADSECITVSDNIVHDIDGSGIVVVDHTDSGGGGYGDANNEGTRVTNNTIFNIALTAGTKYGIALTNTLAGPTTARCLVAHNHVDIDRDGASFSTVPLYVSSDWGSEVVILCNHFEGGGGTFNIDLNCGHILFDSNQLDTPGTIHVNIDSTFIQVVNNKHHGAGDILISNTTGTNGDDCEIKNNLLTTGSITFLDGRNAARCQVSGNRVVNITAWLTAGELSNNQLSGNLAIGGGLTDSSYTTVASNVVAGNLSIAGNFITATGNIVSGDVTCGGSDNNIVSCEITGTLTCTGDRCAVASNSLSSVLTVSGDGSSVTGNTLVNKDIQISADDCVVNGNVTYGGSILLGSRVVAVISPVLRGVVSGNNTTAANPVTTSGGDVIVYGNYCTIDSNVLGGGDIVLETDNYPAGVRGNPTSFGSHTVVGNNLSNPNIMPGIYGYTGGCIVSGNNLCHASGGGSNGVVTWDITTYPGSDGNILANNLATVSAAGAVTTITPNNLVP